MGVVPGGVAGARGAAEDCGEEGAQEGFQQGRNPGVSRRRALWGRGVAADGVVRVRGWEKRRRVNLPNGFAGEKGKFLV